MKNVLLTTIICLFLISNVIAIDSLGTFKQYKQVRISQVCENATYITISSISYPNSSVAIYGVNMTSLGSGEYYYLFNDTSQIGRYNINQISDGCEKTFKNYFEITPSGFINNWGFYAIIILISAGLIVIGIKYQDPILGVLGSFGLYFLGLYVLFFGINGMKDTAYTWAFGLIVLAVALYISIKASHELIID